MMMRKFLANRVFAKSSLMDLRRFFLFILLTLSVMNPSATGQSLHKVTKPLDIEGHHLEAPSCSSFATVGDQVFFKANSIGAGKELWKSDGTPEGTSIIQDTVPGMPDFPTGDFTVMNGAVYFQGDDGVYGKELWKSDGTPEGTAMVKDIYPGQRGSEVKYITAAGNYLFFSAFDEQGMNLWKSDGTAEGTMPVSEEAYQIRSALPEGIYSFKEYAIFVATDNTGTPRLWSVTGNSGQPSSLLVLSTSSFYGGFSAGNQYYFIVSSTSGDDGQLWRTDGTRKGTKFIRAGVFAAGSYAPFGANAATLHDRLFYIGNAAETGHELWTSDGTSSGTFCLRDLCEGSGSSGPAGFFVLDNLVYFVARTPETGTELWRSDGTSEGTFLLKDIYPGPDSPWILDYGKIAPPRYVNADGILYFTAYNNEYGCEVWRTDGTQEGTYLAYDLIPGMDNAFVTQLAWINGTLLMAKEYLYITRPSTSEAPVRLDIYGCYGGSMLGYLFSDADWLYFKGQTNTQSGLWRTDGSRAGTTMLTNIGLPSAQNAEGCYADLGGTRLLVCYTQEYGKELYAFDPDMRNPRLVKDIYPGAGGAFERQPPYLSRIGVQGLFCAEDELGQGLWKTDGTTGGTVKLSAFSSQWDAERIWTRMVLMNDAVYFIDSGEKLWRSDGSEAGTYAIEEPENGYFTTLFFPFHNELYFYYRYPGHYSSGLLKTDGSLGGAIQVALLGMAQDSGIYSLGKTNSRMFITAWGYDASNNGLGYELWVSDGTKEETRFVKDIWPGTGGSAPAQYTAVGERMVFTADDGVHGREIWISDGTPDGTYMIKDILPGLPSSAPSSITAIDDSSFLFAASDRIHGIELWYSDGTESGTYLLGDIAKGPFGSSPSKFYKFDGRVFFSAFQRDCARDLWVFDPHGTSVEGEGLEEGLGEGMQEGLLEGEGLAEGGVEGDGEIQPHEGEGNAEGGLEGESNPHRADQNRDGMIDLPELLRVIQFFNAKGYQCITSGETSEDGYMPGAGVAHACPPHSSDYAPQDWVINLGELLRLIQFYNIGGYASCLQYATEDGYCPQHR